MMMAIATTIIDVHQFSSDVLIEQKMNFNESVAHCFPWLCSEIYEVSRIILVVLERNEGFHNRNEILGISIAECSVSIPISLV